MAPDSKKGGLLRKALPGGPAGLPPAASGLIRNRRGRSVLQPPCHLARDVWRTFGAVERRHLTGRSAAFEGHR